MQASTARRRQYRPTFYCHNCRQTCASAPQGSCTTGYGVTRAGHKVCYACCAKSDRRAMVRTGRACLYLSGHGARVFSMSPATGPAKVSNWPGSLSFPASVTTGRHNIARHQYRVSFRGPDGAQWYGVTVGDNTQICHCRRAKINAA